MPINGKQQLVECERCHRAASTSYSRAGRTITVCELCRDRYLVHEALESRLVQIVELTRDHEFNEALGLLQTILDENEALDHEKWLEGSVLSHQALILEEKGDMDQALETYLMARKSNPSSWIVAINQLPIARILFWQGRVQEAIDEIERGLDVLRQPFQAENLLNLFIFYAQILDTLNQKVPERFLDLFEEALKKMQIRLPTDELQNEPSFNEAIFLAEKQLWLMGHRNRYLNKAWKGDPTS